MTFEEWERKQEKALRQMPTCHICDEVIYEDFFYRDEDGPVCERCIELNTISREEWQREEGME